MSWNLFRCVSNALGYLATSISRSPNRKRKYSRSDSETTGERSERKRSRMWAQEEEECCPFEFHGTVIYQFEPEECACIGNEILKVLNRSEPVVVSFDTKHHWNSSTGADFTSLMSFCFDVNLCYIVQLSEMRLIPKSLTDCLSHPNIKIVGYCIDLHIRKLFLENPHIDMDQILPNCIDLEDLACQVSPRKRKWSLAKLVLHFLKVRIDDTDALRHSRWDMIPLSVEQQLRAVSDVVTGLLLYRYLRRLEAQQHGQD